MSVAGFFRIQVMMYYCPWFRPGCSQQNEQRIRQSSATEIRNLGCLRVTTGPQLLCYFVFPHSAAATTAPLLVILLLTHNPVGSNLCVPFGKCSRICVLQNHNKRPPNIGHV